MALLLWLFLLVGSTIASPRRNQEEIRCFSDPLTQEAGSTSLGEKHIGSSFLKGIQKRAVPWPNNTVRYYFKEGHTQEEQNKIRQGIKILEDNTCVDFIEGNEEMPAAVVSKDNGCSVNILGYSHYPTLSLDHDRCLDIIGITVHEFLHLLGMIHTQARPDRDQYITLYSQSFQHFKEPIRGIIPYDYTSYMHYPGTNSHGTVNMIATDKRYRKTLGNIRGSFYDFYAINEFYSCNEKCASTLSAKCENGGIPHPRNCSACLCPSGFGGELCDERPGTCGKTFLASAEKFQWMTVSLGAEEKKREFAPIDCTHWIEAPPGYKVAIMLTDVQQYGNGERDPEVKESCRYSGFEFKINKDPRYGGAIFCDPEDSGIKLISDLNPAPLILFNYEGKQEYEFLYKAVPIEDTSNSTTVEESAWF